MIIIHESTTKDPISLIGEMSGVCYGSDVEDQAKNYRRGLNCIKTNHGRTLEYPQIYLICDGYSAKMMREFYTHIAGSPTRTQASTRYIDYEHGFDYVTPHTIANNEAANQIYTGTMAKIAEMMQQLDVLGIPKEDSSMLLPLGMTTKVVVRTNLRHLIDMSKQRMCSRAYWEYREFMYDLQRALSNYSDEWHYLLMQLSVFHPKCDDFGYCPEAKSCGRKAKKDA